MTTSQVVPARRRLAGALFLGLVGVVLTVPGPSAAAVDRATITTGSLTWGVKESFRSYVSGPIARGSISATAPAVLSGTVPTFADGSGDYATATATLATRGGVRFTGHGGELDLRISHPRLVVSGTSGTLNVDVVDSAGVATTDLTIGTVSLAGAVEVSGTTVTVSKAPVTLTAAGATAFNYEGTAMYPAGTSMDPVSATFTIESGASASPSASASASSSTSLSPSPSPTPSASSSPSATSSPSPSSSPSATAQPDPSRSGWLSWGIKGSFRSYVTGPIAHGAIAVSGGAQAIGESYRFGQSATSADPPRAAGTSTYRGQVRFTGHGGVLDLAMSSPRVTVTSSGTAQLSLVVSGLGRVQLATLDLAAGSRSAGSDWVAYAGVPARLTSAGTRVFSYDGSAFYPAGTALDPVSFLIGGTAAVGSTDSRTVAAASPVGTGPVASVPASASATGSAAATAALPPGATCPVTDARLDWGFKESFRAYVSGSIANGEWTTSGDAGYQTPRFSWRHGRGGVDPASGAAEVSFAGAVRFTGHHGAMDTTIANPVVRLDGTAHGILVLDVAGVSMADAMAGSSKRTTSTAVEFVELDLAGGTMTRTDGTVTLTAVPARLTAAGQAAFANYTAGTVFDPVTFSYAEDPGCGASAAPSAPAEAAAGDATTTPGWLWAGWAGSSAAGAVLGSAATLLVARRWLVKK